MRRCAFRPLLTAAALSLALQAGASIQWIEKDYDFGLFKEIAGPKTGTSRFVNLGPETVSVVDVKPSCGCTSADFTDTPLAPGDTAVISYTYDPTMRPGKFDKSVKVRLSDGTRQTIRIRGNVLGTPESLATLYPVDAGGVRLSDRVINAGDVTFGRSPVAFINAYVLAQDSISPRLVPESKALVISPSADKAGPGDIVTFSLNFDSRRHNVYGPVEIPISLIGTESSTDEFVAPSCDASFRAFVLPDTDALLLKQQNKVPACDLSPDPVVIGDTAGRTSVYAEFTIRNGGKGPLEIYRIYCDSDAVSFGKLPTVIKPGKSARIKLEIDTAKLPDGPQRVPVGIITSDPHHPHLELPLAINKN